jgi:hypothetical protein
MELAFCYVCQDHIRKNIGEFRRTSSMGHEFYYVGLLNPQETGVVVRTAVISDILHIDRKLYEQLLLNYMGVKTLRSVMMSLFTPQKKNAIKQFLGLGIFFSRLF